MNDKTLTLDSYIRTVENQEIKGILLKLKNEMRKPDVTWDAVKSVLLSLKKKDEQTAREILLLLLEG